MPIPLFAAFTAWADESCRAAWLNAPELTVTGVESGTRVHGRWSNGARLEVRFVGLGPAKCRILIRITGLPDAMVSARTKDYWREQFLRLCAYLGV
ncbi:MAG: hypothetical protein WB784_07360 [Rhodanobacteraceae bacterium]